MTRKRFVIFLAGAAVLALTAVAVAGCGGSGASAPTTANGQPATVGVENSGLGNILVDSQGRTLYLFQKDSGTTSECTGACASNWPPLEPKASPTVGSGANASLLGTTTRSDGARQVTYSGHPLYLYRGDQKPGDTTGQGLVDFGAAWYALSPAGDQITGQASSAGY